MKALRFFAFGSILASSSIGLAQVALAQSWPAKPVRMIVPQPPGGGIDTVARSIAQKLSESLKQPFVVENRAGAAGIIGADLVAKAPKDGYTYLVASTTLAITAVQYRKLPFDPVADFAPTTQIINTYQMLAVNPQVPANSVKELVALAQKMGGKMNFGSTGLGASSHLASELFKLEAKFDALHIPYKGDAQLQPAILSNDVQFMIATPTAILPHLKTGRLRALAVTGATRGAAAPDIPTMGEAGYPGVEMTGWIGLLATGGSPREALMRVSEATAQALKAPDLAPRVPSWGGEAAGTTPDEFAARYRSDIAKYGRIMREAKIPYAD